MKKVGCIGCLGLIGFIFLVMIIGSLLSPSANRTPASAPAPRNTAAATKVAVSKVNQQWGEFLVYAPRFGDILKRSDEVNRVHAQGAGLASAATVVQFYQLTDQAARSQGVLKLESIRIKVPSEGEDFKDSVFDTLRQREDAMNKLKEALNRPGVAGTAAYQEAKTAVDRSTVRTVLRLIALCEKMEATTDECFTSSGISR